MTKVFKYFQDNGLAKTINRIIRKSLGFLGLNKSETCVLNIQINSALNSKPSSSNYIIMQLREEKVDEFNKVKYYDFIDGRKIVDSNQSTAFIALDDNQIIGYVCCHFNTKHLIHNMGSWTLNDDEAWIGPTYVMKNYRNKSIHRLLLIETIRDMYSLGITKFYTAINVNNTPSLKSFSNVGFKKIGVINNRKIFNKIIKLKISETTNRRIIAEKFCAL